jgi:hypothetical protein
MPNSVGFGKTDAIRKMGIGFPKTDTIGHVLVSVSLKPTLFNNIGFSETDTFFKGCRFC